MNEYITFNDIEEELINSDSERSQRVLAIAESKFNNTGSVDNVVMSNIHSSNQISVDVSNNLFVDTGRNLNALVESRENLTEDISSAISDVSVEDLIKDRNNKQSPSRKETDILEKISQASQHSVKEYSKEVVLIKYKNKPNQTRKKMDVLQTISEASEQSTLLIHPSDILYDSTETMIAKNSTQVLNENITADVILQPTENIENQPDKHSLENLDVTLIADSQENMKTEDVKNTSIISYNWSNYNKIQNNICVNDSKRKITDDLMNNRKLRKTIKFSEENEHEDLENSVNETDENFTRMIFEPDETADNNDPKWKALKELKTNEDYFNSVRKQWKSMTLVNPHKDLTKRYMPDVPKKENLPDVDQSRVITCYEYITNKISAADKEIYYLQKQLDSCRNFKRFNKRQNETTNKIYELEKTITKIEKNREEVKNINMFYHDPLVGWDANHLSSTQLEELKQQEKVLEFYKTFYK